MVTTEFLKDVRQLKDVQAGESIQFEEDIVALGITKGTKGQVVQDAIGSKAVKLSGSQFTNDPVELPLNTFVLVTKGVPSGSTKRWNLSSIAKRRPSKEDILKAGQTGKNIIQQAISTGRETVLIGKGLYEQYGGGSKTPTRKTTSTRASTTRQKITTAMPTNKNQRDKFLDAWFDVSPRTFNSYHQQYGGNGKLMVEALQQKGGTTFNKVRNEWSLI